MSEEIRAQRRFDPDLTGGLMPTPAHQLLLAAALFEPAAAQAAWAEWHSRFAPAGTDPLRAIDPGSVRILPLVYRNLLKIGAIDAGDLPPVLARAKAFHRQTLLRNQM